MKSKSKTYGLFILFVMVLGLLPVLDTFEVVSGYTSQAYPFGINQNTTITVVSEAPLSWNENERVNLTVTLNATAVPIGENITIVLITVMYNYPDDPDPHPYTSKSPDDPDKNLTEVGHTYEYPFDLQAPSDEDIKKFNITIRVLVKSTSEDYNQEFEAFFPGDAENPYIDIKTDVVLPIINLPGFPDIQTFGRWIFIFGVILIIIALPSIFVASSKTHHFIKNIDVWKEKRKQQKDEKRIRKTERRLKQRLKKEGKRK